MHSSDRREGSRSPLSPSSRLAKAGWLAGWLARPWRMRNIVTTYRYTRAHLYKKDSTRAAGRSEAESTSINRTKSEMRPPLHFAIPSPLLLSVSRYEKSLRGERETFFYSSLFSLFFTRPFLFILPSLSLSFSKSLFLSLSPLPLSYSHFFPSVCPPVRTCTHTCSSLLRVSLSSCIALCCNSSRLVFGYSSLTREIDR